MPPGERTATHKGGDTARTGRNRLFGKKQPLERRIASDPRRAEARDGRTGCLARESQGWARSCMSFTVVRRSKTIAFWTCGISPDFRTSMAL